MGKPTLRPDSSEAIAARLREIRMAWDDGAYAERDGQKAFAKLLTLGYTQWNNYEKGSRRPTHEAIAKITAVTGALQPYIIHGTGLEHSPTLQRELAKFRAKQAKRGA